jgi:hypothetical protein
MEELVLLKFNIKIEKIKQIRNQIASDLFKKKQLGEEGQNTDPS